MWGCRGFAARSQLPLVGHDQQGADELDASRAAAEVGVPKPVVATAPPTPHARLRSRPCNRRKDRRWLSPGPKGSLHDDGALNSPLSSARWYKEIDQAPRVKCRHGERFSAETREESADIRDEARSRHDAHDSSIEWILEDDSCAAVDGIIDRLDVGAD